MLLEWQHVPDCVFFPYSKLHQEIPEKYCLKL